MSTRPRCFVYVLTPSLGTIEAFLSLVPELRRRGHRVITLALEERSLTHIRTHPVYGELVSGLTELVTVRREGERGGPFTLAKLLKVLVPLRLRHGRLIFIHTRKSVTRSEVILNKILDSVGIAYNFRTNSGIITEVRALRRVPEHDAEIQRQFGAKPTKPPEPQARIAYTEDEARVLREVLGITDPIQVAGIPKLHPGWPGDARPILERQLAEEMTALGLKPGTPFAVLAITHLTGPWYKDDQSAGRILDWVVAAMRRHMPDTVLLIKPKPYHRERIEEFVRARAPEHPWRLSVCPHLVLSQGARIAFSVESASALEFLFTEVPTIDVYDHPPFWDKFARSWAGTPGLADCGDAESVDAAVAAVAEGRAPAFDRQRLAAHFGHQDASLDTFLRTA